MARTAPLVEDPATDDERLEEADLDGLPPRPRRRLLSPLPLVLLAVLIAAAGFIGGVQVQKHQDSGSATSGLPAGLAAAFAARGEAGGAPGAGAADGAAGAQQSSGTSTSGQVSSIKGSVLYVAGADGTTIKVKVPSSATVSRTADTDAKAIHPGDSVVVRGAAGANGTVTAASVTAIAAGVSVAGGLPGGAAAGAAGGTAAGGAAGAGGGAAGSGSDVGSLFGG